MLSDDEITGQQQLLAAHRRTLAVYLQQQAEIGRAYSPPSLINGIAEARINIRHIKQRLHDAGVATADHPDDSESLDILDAHSHTRPGTALPHHPATRQPRRWLISSVLGVGAVVLVALLVARFLTSTGAATPSQSFTYSFPNGTSDWGVDNQADANKWQVIQAAAGNFVYQGSVPSDQDHDITSAPPSDDIIKDWQGYAVETKVRVVHSGTTDYAFYMVMRGEDNAPSGCWGYQFLFNTSQAQAEIKLDGPLDRCPPKTLAHGSLPVGGDQWFTVRIEAVGIHLRLYIDGNLILQADDAILPKGYFAVSIVPGATVQFDDIRIWEITAQIKSFQSSKLAL
jgi:hypothetical protein